ncbi:MAG: UDP-N-acetylmuramoyl-tripeptide--D-alanyl-D-alanine ligase [Rhodobacteraceae bacterium]|nr:UDP-N-acetylmuramoyl-tripeptide--D-alanyl-D-alanine ligase [Paracoccaceae bacterium]
MVAETWTGLAVAILLFVPYGLFAYRRMLRYLHIYQQEEYDSTRFAPWLISTGSIDRKLTAMLALVAIGWFVAGEGLSGWIWIALIVLCFLGVAMAEPDPRGAAKKPLRLTARASKILWVALGVAALVGLVSAWAAPYWGWPIAVQLLPLHLMAANLALSPLEARVQQKFWDEAHQKVMRLDTAVIGITGSFGKTSVKHLLHHALSMQANSFMTPGSINTPMGIARVVRETLPEDTDFFVVEMGAYGPGSIDRLCRLTPPKLGMLTSLGVAHYERFKSLDTVARAKLELAEHVFKHPDGKLIAHSSTRAVPYAAEFIAAHRERIVLCGEDEDADVRVLSVEQDAEGLRVAMAIDGGTLEARAPIYGRQHGQNIALVIGAAKALGLPLERAASALRTAPQISHRLELKPQANGAAIIDDAYNSNPTGFKAGLELLDTLASARGGRRILITPGMVELGEQHDALHAELGTEAAARTDLALVIQPERIPSFVDAFGANAEKVIRLERFEQAAEWMGVNLRDGDVALLENDLPDIYERRLSL